VEISVNGEPRQVEVGCTVAVLLEQLKLQPRYLAVERNQQLVPRATHANCVLQPGDGIEIVTLVGGG
jgi:thiamine biosynthesis protein ThiS